MATLYVVATPIGGHREVRDVGVLPSRLDAGDPLPFGRRWEGRGQIGPVLAFILCYPQFAIVGARPEHALFRRGLRERIHDAVRFGAAAGGDDLLQLVS